MEKNPLPPSLGEVSALWAESGSVPPWDRIRTKTKDFCLAHAPLEGAPPHEAGRRLLEALYRRETGGELPEIAISPRGKPYFQDAPLYFSISHTRRHVFCALSTRPIGLDAEETGRNINLKLAEKILSPSERARYEAAADQRLALLRFWVLKEAEAKCSGQGLRGYPNHTDFSPDDPRIQELAGCLVAVITEAESL